MAMDRESIINVSWLREERLQGSVSENEPMRMFRADRDAVFLDRPNRFMVRVQSRGRTLRAYCPNPGRMTGLLQRGAHVVLEHSQAPGRRLVYTLAAVRRDDAVVPVVSVRANDLAAASIVPLIYPDAVAVRREVRRKESRFDFLVTLPDAEVLLEVKACTLVEEGLALFPDAPSMRAARHLRELACTSTVAGGAKADSACGRQVRGAVLFVVFSPDALAFMPNVHTDPGFARTFVECAPLMDVHAASIRTHPDGTAEVEKLRLPVEYGILGEIAADAGVYLFALELERQRTLNVGSLGDVRLDKGWYVYAGSARGGLSRRLARHGRRIRRKAIRWHIDFLRTEARAVRAFPIHTRHDLECRLAQDVAAISAEMVPRFGCSDCSCPSHLFRFLGDPQENPQFIALLSRYRHRLALGR
jgi:sugar fermentation stimulation protein A